jgi:heme exporter protein A
MRPLRRICYPRAALTHTFSLLFDRLGKAYDGPAVFAGISLEFSAGLLAVRGPNGSGKSTLLLIAAGLLPPSAGRSEVLRDGQPLAGTERKLATGWCSPELAFYDELTARENMRFFARASGLRLDAEAVGSRLAEVSLAHAADRAVGAYSSGMRQRLRLAFAFLFDSPVVLLDEPSSNLDDEGRGLLARLVERQRRNGIVVLATNDLRDLSAPDGEIVMGGLPS